MAMTRKRMLRVGLYGSFGIVIIFVLLNPYLRQSLFGPKIRDLPLCYWQDAFRHFADPDAHRDSLTVRALQWLGMGRREKFGGLPEGDDMLPVLLSLVDDPQPRVREIVAYNLGGPFPPEEVMPVLLRMLDDPKADVRAAAALSLGRIRPLAVAALRRLLELMEDGDGECRVQASWAVWRIGQKKHPEVLAVLRQALKDPKPLARYEAVQVLGQMKTDAADAFPDLVAAATEDPHPRVRTYAVLNLDKFGRSVVPVLIKALRDTDPSIRAIAAKGLGTCAADAKDALPALQRLLSDPDAGVRTGAIAAIQRIDPEQFPPPKAEPE